uniref:Uncharacterized protein n=1 Tax=Panagrolaimus superbus TaxID=310955 RepID=A0A914Z9L4_9BILA
MIISVFLFILGNLIFVCYGCLRSPTVDSSPSIIITTTTMNTISCGANPCPPVPPGIGLGVDVTATGPSVTGSPPSCAFSYTLTCTRVGATGLIVLTPLSEMVPSPTTFTCDGTSQYTYDGGKVATFVTCNPP